MYTEEFLYPTAVQGTAKKEWFIALLATTNFIGTLLPFIEGKRYSE